MTGEVDQQLQTSIEAIRPEGWWQPVARQRYLELGEQLAAHGIPRDEIISILHAAFQHAVHEYSGPGNPGD